MIRCIALTLALSATAAAACDQDDAEARWMQAEVAAVVLGVGMLNDIPTAQVDSATWEQMDLATRSGLVATFECLLAGPGNVLAKAQVVDAGGVVLATSDGVNERFEQPR